MNDINVKWIAPTKWWKRGKWKLLSDFESFGNIVVPKDFISDVASIPFFARAFFSPTGKFFPAAIVHDWSLAQDLPWSEALGVFKYELSQLKEVYNIPNWRVFIVYNGVKIWGSIRDYYWRIVSR